MAYEHLERPERPTRSHETMTTRIDPTQFPDGQPVAKSALRDTVATIRDKFGETLSVKDFGARGDNTGDDGPAFQAGHLAAAGGTVECAPSSAS